MKGKKIVLSLAASLGAVAGLAACKDNVEEVTKYNVIFMNGDEVLSETEVDEFLQLSRNKLENNGYDVYFTGAKYKYHGEEKIVETNQYIVAIKDGAKN